LEFLDGVDHRVVRHLPRLRLQYGDTVEEILVRTRPPAVDPRQHGVWRQGDAGGNAGEHDEQAAVQRQLRDLLMLDNGPEASGLRSYDRRVRDDRHLFSNIADAEVEIDSGLFASREPNALAPNGLEPCEVDVDAVLTGRQARGRVDTIASRND